MQLKESFIFEIIPTAPFNFDGTFYKPSHFSNELSLDHWEPGSYWQSFRIGRILYGLKIENSGASEKLKLKVTIYSDNKLSDKEISEIKAEIIWRFELDTDLSEFNNLARKDKRFYPVFKKWLGMRNSSQYALYELLIIAIVLQNTTVRRSQQMLDALLDKFGTKLEFDGREIWAIWLPEDLEKASEADLRDLRIGYRAKFIKRLSQDFADNLVNEEKLRTLDKEEVKKELMKLYGVGPETARILLFEVCHQYDTFDHIAPWQQKIYSQLFYGKPLVSVDKIRNDIVKQYGKYSMLAVHYIWEDIFWRRRNEKIDWLEKEIRL